jgi:hypothetical protein
VSREVYREYGIVERTPGEYEVDHLVPLETGGSNDIANLFPEAAEPRPGFHEKDQVENYLHDQVCTGRMKLFDAQLAIATDWLQVFDDSASRGCQLWLRRLHPICLRSRHPRVVACRSRRCLALHLAATRVSRHARQPMLRVRSPTRHRLGRPPPLRD